MGLGGLAPSFARGGGAGAVAEAAEFVFVGDELVGFLGMWMLMLAVVVVVGVRGGVVVGRATCCFVFGPLAVEVDEGEVFVFVGGAAWRDVIAAFHGGV